MASSIDLIRRKTVFDPEAVTVLAAALDEAWDLLRKSGSECVRPAYARVMREVVARRIFDLGQGGISGLARGAAASAALFKPTVRRFFKRKLPAREQRTVLGNNSGMRSRRLRFLRSDHVAQRVE